MKHKDTKTPRKEVFLGGSILSGFMLRFSDVLKPSKATIVVLEG